MHLLYSHTAAGVVVSIRIFIILKPPDRLFSRQGHFKEHQAADQRGGEFLTATALAWRVLAGLALVLPMPHVTPCVSADHVLPSDPSAARHQCPPRTAPA